MVYYAMRKGEGKLEISKPSSPKSIALERWVNTPDKYKYILTNGAYETAIYSYSRYGNKRDI